MKMYYPTSSQSHFKIHAHKYEEKLNGSLKSFAVTPPTIRKSLTINKIVIQLRVNELFIGLSQAVVDTLICLESWILLPQGMTFFQTTFKLQSWC